MGPEWHAPVPCSIVELISVLGVYEAGPVVEVDGDPSCRVAGRDPVHIVLICAVLFTASVTGTDVEPGAGENGSGRSVAAGHGEALKETVNVHAFRSVTGKPVRFCPKCAAVVFFVTKQGRVRKQNRCRWWEEGRFLESNNRRDVCACR